MKDFCRQLYLHLPTFWAVLIYLAQRGAWTAGPLTLAKTHRYAAKNGRRRHARRLVTRLATSVDLHAFTSVRLRCSERLGETMNGRQKTGGAGRRRRKEGEENGGLHQASTTLFAAYSKHATARRRFPTARTAQRAGTQTREARVVAHCGWRGGRQRASRLTAYLCDPQRQTTHRLSLACARGGGRIDWRAKQGARCNEGTATHRLYNTLSSLSAMYLIALRGGAALRRRRAAGVARCAA